MRSEIIRHFPESWSALILVYVANCLQHLRVLMGDFCCFGNTQLVGFFGCFFFSPLMTHKAWGACEIIQQRLLLTCDNSKKKRVECNLKYIKLLLNFHVWLSDFLKAIGSVLLWNIKSGSKEGTAYTILIWTHEECLTLALWDAVARLTS